MPTTEQTLQTAAIDKDQVRESLERLGNALSTRDLKVISGCWEVPALVVSDEGAIPVSSAEEIEKFFAQSIEWYRSRGLVAARPEIERFEALTERLAAVDVRWLALDESGSEKGSERSHYILRLGDDEVPRVKVALSRTGPGQVA
jgi:hypothetical protein